MITYMNYIIAVTLLLLPGITLAQSGSLQGMITGIGDLVNNYLIPFVLAVAFFVFVYNAYRFFILAGSTEDGRENAKNLAIYSVFAFTFFVIFWGLLNFFVDGVGLDNDPCSSDTVSDYVISDLAPCTSPRPRPRPFEPPDTTAPGGGFGTGVGGVEDPIIVPGGGTGPTGGTAPVSFNPDGTEVAYNPVLAAQNTIRTTATPFFTTQINDNFGYNRDVVAPLFADLGSTYTNTTTELNRLKAAVRLNELGVISDAQVTTYLNAYNTYAAAAGTLSAGPLTLASVSSNLAVTPPAALQSRKNATRQTFIDTLTAYNATNNVDSADVDVAAAIAEIYDPTISADMRHELMLEVFYPPARVGGPSATQLPINTQAKNAFIEKFTSDINAEKIYAGDFTMLR